VFKWDEVSTPVIQQKLCQPMKTTLLLGLRQITKKRERKCRTKDMHENGAVHSSSAPDF
jgi:hypothetical protein